MADTHEKLPIALVMENTARRSTVISLFNKAGIKYFLSSAGIPITDMNELAESSVIVLDTDDDVASLVDIVHQIYKQFPADATLPIIGMISSHQRALNPRLNAWLIDHHAAVACILDFDDLNFLTYLTNMITRLTKQ